MKKPSIPPRTGFAEDATTFPDAPGADEVVPGSVAEQQALRRFVRAVRAHYGDRVSAIVLFGSRARGDAHAASDADVAVVLADGVWSAWQERRVLTDLGYDVLLEDGLDIQPWPITASDWTATRQASQLVDAARRDGRDLGAPP